MKADFLNDQQLADYLNLSLEEIRQRVKFREIPFQKRGQRVVFSKGEIDAWASRRILQLSEKGLADYHQRVSRGPAGCLLESALLPRMLPPGFAAPAMTSKTKASILRDLVALAEQTGQLNDPAALLESLVAREEIGSTGLAGGIAVPHPCHHDPYLFESSFIVAGRTLQAVNFGAPDGRPSKLFFLICCQDDQLHLHTLARLCRMAQQTDVVIRSSSSSSSDPEAFRLGLLSAEQEALAKD